MHRYTEIPVADLLLDPGNARLKDEQSSQQATVIALAKLQGRKLLRLAADIMEKGTDPIALLAVVPEDGASARFRVIEGNRRLVALKALETPSLVAGALDAKSLAALNKLATRYAEATPITSLMCAVFETEEQAAHWVRLRHTGDNDGVGLSEWGSDEKDRFSARSGKRSIAGQIIDFVEAYGGLSGPGREASKPFITSLTRLVATPEVREILGIKVQHGEVLALYPANEVAKGLTRVVEDLKTDKLRVKHIYRRDQRLQYAKNLSASELPDPATRLAAPIPLGAPADTSLTGLRKPRPQRQSYKKPEPRNTLIPRDCQLNVSHSRIEAIYHELLNMALDRYPNACSVTLRVFLELSVDHFIEQNNLLTANAARNLPLAKRLKLVAEHLHSQAAIPAALLAAMKQVADSSPLLAASIPTFNMYVHNHYVVPTPGDLRGAWDQLQPFMEKLWP